MAKKISAIVIPAVIDTTGIDKGISSIKTKLSGVRGSIGTRNSGTGGVGGGGNFGAGLAHYGGSAVTVGAAAAVGAGLGRRGGGMGEVGSKDFINKFKQMSQKQQDLFIKTEQMKNNFASKAVNRFGVNMAKRGLSMLNQGEAFTPGVNAAGTGFVPGIQRIQNNAMRLKGMKAMTRGNNISKFSQNKMRESYGASDSGEESMFTPKRLATGVITAGVAAAAYVRQNFTQGGIKSNFSDLSNLEGSPGLYNRAAAIKRRTYGPTGMPTFAQAMIIGSDLQSENTSGRKNAEGVASQTDRLIAGIGVTAGKRIEFISSILTGEAFKGNNFLKGLKSVFT